MGWNTLKDQLLECWLLICRWPARNNRYSLVPNKDTHQPHTLNELKMIRRSQVDTIAHEHLVYMESRGSVLCFWNCKYWSCCCIWGHEWYTNLGHTEFPLSLCDYFTIIDGVTTLNVEKLKPNDNKFRWWPDYEDESLLDQAFFGKPHLLQISWFLLLVQVPTNMLLLQIPKPNTYKLDVNIRNGSIISMIQFTNKLTWQK